MSRTRRSQVLCVAALVATAACAQLENEKPATVTTAGDHAVVAGSTIHLTASTANATDSGYMWQSADPDKGHFEQLSRFGDAISAAGTSPIPFSELVEASAVALHIEDLLHGRTVAE